jgi:3-dehydroquinate synthase
MVLQTLPEREYVSGLYEALKYGIIRDVELFADFEQNHRKFLSRDPEAIERLVSRCAAIKADVVMKDEREGDLRRILNFGHTVGHGLETATHYRSIKHGEAVGYGMIAAARIGQSLDKLTAPDCARIEEAIGSLGRLPALKGVRSQDVLKAVQHDKKVRDGAVHFVLPRTIGQVEITPSVPFELVRDVVKGILNDGKRSPGPG